MIFAGKIVRRWSDMDAIGHINNATYLVYLEQVRVDFLAAAAEAGVQREVGGILVARNEIDYRMPMPYGTEPIEIPTWIDRIGTSSFTFGYEVAEGETVFARARTVCVCVDAAGRPSPVPNGLKTFLQGYTK